MIKKNFIVNGGRDHGYVVFSFGSHGTFFMKVYQIK